MMAKGVLDQFICTEQDRLALAEEEAVALAAIVIAQLLEDCDVSQRELAKRLGITEGRISQILAAESNPTVKTMARIGHVLGRRLELNFVQPHSAAEPAVAPEAKMLPFIKPAKAVQRKPWRRRENDDNFEVADYGHAVG